MDLRSFKKLFVPKVLNENLGMISSLIMLADHKAIFAMFLSCYAQHLSYYVSMSRYFATLR